MTIASKIREVSYLFAILTISIIGMVWLRTVTVRDTYTFVQQEREFRQLNEEIQAQRVRYLRMTTPHRLEILALEHGLFPPKVGQVFKMASPVDSTERSGG